MITSLGVGSGLNLQSLVDQLVAAEQQPALARLNLRESRQQANLSAFSTLTAAIDSLRSASEKLAELAPSRALSISGESEAITASASDSSALGQYSVTVSNLATAHILSTVATSDATSPVGGGTLTLQFGTLDYDPGTDAFNGFVVDPGVSDLVIDIAPGSSLNDIRDAINAASGPVSASVVNDASGARLTLASTQTGTEASLNILVSDDDGNDTDASGLSLLAFNSSSTQLEQVQAASDAQLTINGLDLVSRSNTGISAIEGLTIDLESTTSGTGAVVKVENNHGAVRQALNEFITAYNEFDSLIAEIAAYDPETGQAGTLFGDSTLRSVVSGLRNGLSQGHHLQGVGSLVQAGIDSNDQGQLSLDGDRLDQLLDLDYELLVSTLNDRAGQYTESIEQLTGPGGLVPVRTEGIQDRLDAIAEDRVTLDQRIAQLEKRLNQRFAALDSLLAGLQTTSSFISNQLDQLNQRTPRN